MIPIITGVIASSITKTSIFNWAGSLDQCGAVTGYTAYTTSPILSIGVKVYYNAALTQTWYDNLGSLFIYNNVAYILDLDSLITASYAKVNNSAPTYGGCGDTAQSSTVYPLDTGFTPGTKVYTVCYEDSSMYASGTFFVGNGVGQSIIVMAGDGTVFSNTGCGT